MDSLVKSQKFNLSLPFADENQPRAQRNLKKCCWKHLASLAVVVISLSLLKHHYYDSEGPPLSLFDIGGHPPKPHHRLSAEEAEDIFLSVPNAESALRASREYATHPHLAGLSEDYEDAKTILKLFQDELGIHPPKEEPIFPAGSHQSRHSTLRLSGPFAPRRPTAWVDTYYPVMNTPLNRSLEILDDDGNTLWNADLVEDGDPLDKEAAKYRDAVPTWHGFSFDGIASGQLVYANYGTQEDYASLVAQGVDLKGKVVITRYGQIFRGLKVKGAYELGAAGVLIYSDPRDDGTITVENGFKPYPAGPARNPSSVQRGSVQYLSLYPGDPTTPGYPAYKDAERQEGINIPKIPSLPISWKNAERLLKEIGDIYTGEVATGGQRQLSGRASKRTIKLVNHVDTKVTPIWNTMASIPGHIKNEVVLIGCHRDAWVMGAADPTSGTVSLREIVRGFGTLLKQGWKPIRTIVIASWDAEEYGLVGSTEWGEDFGDWISQHVVAYLNVDVSVYGSRWNVASSPSLANIIKKTALDIPHPTAAGKSLWNARHDLGAFVNNQTATFPGSGMDADFFRTFEADEKRRMALKTGVFPLGSGSDYTVFLQHIGVASTDQGFGSALGDAVYHYHSIYDSQRWQETYADPTFERHVAVAKHLGLLSLRLIDAIVLPLNTTQYSLELDTYLDDVEALAPAFSQDETADSLVLRKALRGPLGEAPYFSILRNSIKHLQNASRALDAEKAEAEERFKEILKELPAFLTHKGRCAGRHSGFMRRLAFKIKRFSRYLRGSQPSRKSVLLDAFRKLRTPEEVLAFGIETVSDEEMNLFPFPVRKFIKAAKRVGRANQKLVAYERGFISKGGIKDREWYKHLGVAPGKWLGYGATTFPALTEAITIDKSTERAAHETQRLVQLLDKLAERIEP